MKYMLLITTTLVLVFLPLTTTTSPVSIKLLVKDNGDGPIYINFYEDYFLKLYSCMVNTKSLTCTAELVRDDKHPNEVDDIRVSRVDKPKLLSSARGYTNVFTCSFTTHDQRLSCSRLFINASTCDNHHSTQFFYFTNSSSRSFKCVGLKWKSPNESLIYDPTVNGIEICNSSCSTDSWNSSGVKPDNHLRPSRPIFGTRVTEDMLRHTTHKFHRGDNDFGDHDNDDDKSKSHIIIAVVVSIAVTAALIISGIFFRRHIMRLTNKSPSNGDKYVGDSPSDHSNYNNSFQLGKTHTLYVYPPESDDHHPSIA